MAPRILQLDLTSIIFELLAPGQGYWAWDDDTRFLVIGDLEDLRLHLHTLPKYLALRDADRAKRALPNR